MSESSTGEETIPGGAGENENPSGSPQPLPDKPNSEDDNGGESSTPQDDNKPTSMADAVRAALAGGKEQSSGSGEDEGGEPGAATDPDKAKKAKEGEEEELGELTEEELASYKPKTQARIKKLLKTTENLTDEVKVLKPEADSFRAIQKFAQDANLTKDDVNSGFEIMKLMKNDPRRAYELLTPVYTTLQQLVGEILPKSLQERVTRGEISKEDALAMARLAADNNLSTVNRKQTEEQAIENRKREETVAVQKLSADVAMAMTNWESSWKASDPDFSLKHSRVMEAVELELTKQVLLAKEGKPNKLPRSTQEAIQMAEDIKKKVDKEMQRFAPKRSPITHLNGKGSTNESRPVPKTIYEAVGQALGRA